MGQDPMETQAAGLLETLRSVAQRFTGAESSSESETIQAIVRSAVNTVPGADQAGVSLLHRDGSVTSQAVSHASIADVDMLQAQYREGPCVTALWDEHTVSVPDMTDEAGRWPQFAPQAAAAGVGSMLSFQLYARDASLGALNLYARQPGSFDTDADTLGGLFAMHAAAALGEARHICELHQAISTRDLIGQAKGMLMERFGVDPEQAFQMLVTSSQETNLKLAAVAQWLTDQAQQ